MVLLRSVAAAEKPLGPATPSLVIEPATGQAISGPQGGPLAPPSFQYRVRASSGVVDYSIRTPSWLTASSSVGKVGTDGVTITFTASSSAFRLQPGTYGPSIAFTNVTNGQGTGTRPVTLTIQARSIPPRPAERNAPKSDKGFLLDEQGKYLLDERGEKLLAR